jgi:cyanophycinase
MGTLALVGGGEWGDGCRVFDEELLATAGGEVVVVLPSAAAFEHPERVVERATTYFESLHAKVRPLDVFRRADAEDPGVVDLVRKARFVYLSDGSPLHLRSVLKGSTLWDAILGAYHAGGVLAASGAGATLVCDPMVDPRGGAYTVGLGVVTNLAIFPYHGTAADHLRERSIDLLPAHAKLVGIDDETALIREPAGAWRTAGRGTVTVYSGRDATAFAPGKPVPELEA